MSEQPFMQFYVADYLGDTQILTTEQHGAYLLLLMTMWRAGGSVPDDDQKLARIVRLTRARWVRIKPDIIALLVVKDGVVTQKRLAEELEKASEKSHKRADAGRSGGIAKALKVHKPPLANATVLLKHSSEPEVIKKKESNATAKAAALPSLEFPPWWPKEAWDGFAEMRKRIRAPLTARAIELIVREVTGFRQAGQDPAAVLDQSTQKSWRGIFAIKAPNGNGSLFSRDEQPACPVDSWVSRLKVFHGMTDAKPGAWGEAWGPKPNDPTNRIPAEAVRRFEAERAKTQPKERVH